MSNTDNTDNTDNTGIFYLLQNNNNLNFFSMIQNIINNYSNTQSIVQINNEIHDHICDTISENSQNIKFS